MRQVCFADIRAPPRKITKKVNHHLATMDVTDVIGEFGKFQRNVYLFCLLRGIPNGLHLVVYSFFLPTVEYWCARPEYLAANFTSEQWKEFVLPNSTFPDDNTASSWNRCTTFDTDVGIDANSTAGRERVPCERWEYGRSYYKSSLVQEWDLVCSRAWMRSLVQTATMSGMLAGTLVSSLGDRFGRRPMVIAGFVSSLVGSVCVALSPWFSVVLVSRGILGFGLGLGQSSSFCLLMEVIGPQKRTTTAVAFSIGFALGIVTLPAFAWFLQEWRTMQGAITVPILVIVVWSWYLPESPRWLIATGKISEARKVILKACADNGRHIEDVDLVLAELRKKILQQDASKEEVSCLDLVRSRRVFLYTCVLVYASAVGGMVFYALQLSVTVLGGNPYVTFLIAAAAEFPVALICYVAIRWCSRRRTMFVLYATAGTCALVVGVMPPAWVVARQTFAITGKMLASGSLTLIWLFAAEVLPTLYRSAGFSACLIGTRVGSSTAPFLLELKAYLPESVPMGILSGAFLLGACLVLLLPETFRKALPDTIQECKDLRGCRKPTKRHCPNSTTDSKLLTPLSVATNFGDDEKYSTPREA